MTEPLPPFPDVQDTLGQVDLTLPSAGGRPPLRADAARNRTRLLEVAAELAAERGAANVTMEAVATAAKVGKGTVFRRFGDRAGLMYALLDHHEQQLQAAFLMGPPPLGPDAPAAERLRAFGPAVIRHEHAHRDLYLAAHEDAARNYRGPAYQLRIGHVALLLRQLKTGGDIELMAHTLLGYIGTLLADHLVTQRGMSLERLEAGWYDLVARLGAAA
ncbi:TetR/AcrR family transcriptional regulator [Streptomyces sp. HC44]|uniref:TetR/AcrR family transcriptional regulator n=1 Tax=Streptomyces scabichelini TaxID=2711217 RepID=A0A6G4V5J8_9ACTN|nr:TetR/AcrR family transcriptional regulator [Streptomyces scabichelini]NGO09251.1 TetR/AcrR family transcriptional regulator [Streptomyces scabichelini]